MAQFYRATLKAEKVAKCNKIVLTEIRLTYVMPEFLAKHNLGRNPQLPYNIPLYV